MTLLPAVRAQIEVAATRRVNAPRSASPLAAIARSRRFTASAAAAACAASLVLLLGSPSAPQPRSARAPDAPPAAAALTPAAPARMLATDDLHWTLGLSETIP